MKKHIILVSGLALVIAGIGGIYFYYKPAKKMEAPVVQVAKSESYIDSLIAKINQGRAGEMVNPATMDDLRALYKDINMRQIPRQFVDKLPADFSIDSVADKTLFLKIITALMLRTNEMVALERKVILALDKKYQQGQDFTESEQAFFNHLVQKYDVVSYKTLSAQLSQLVIRIDEVPVSLGVAQAILFSNWGQENPQSLYGQYGWIDNKTYVPIKYDSLTTATDKYVLSLNNRSQLEAFRAQRRRMTPLKNSRYLGPDLTRHLDLYMEDEKEYQKKLAAVYKQGLIKELDRACFIGECE